MLRRASTAAVAIASFFMKELPLVMTELTIQMVLLLL